MPETATGSGVNNPDLSPALKVRTRSIRNAEESAGLIKHLIESNRERNRKNARIMAKYNSEKPHTQAALDNEGLGWKSNFSTKPLPLLIEKVAPRFRTALDTAKYLTNSKLPDDKPGAAKKTEAFRREITETCRARRGWKSLISQIAQENALFGYTAAAWLDEYTWFPKFFRQDEFFIPSGTKQDPDSAQVVILKEDFLIHELFSHIEHKEEAEDAGWNVENTVEAINSAMPLDRQSKETGDWDRVHQDLVREASVGVSYNQGAKVVTVYNLLVVELDGRVSHFRLEDRAWKELFTSEDRFLTMADALAFFSFQQGNGTMHGSKGIGRELYAMAGILDRSRNDVVDRLLLAGKVIIQGDPRLLKRFRMSIVGNAILIGNDYNVSQARIDGDVEPFMALDNYLTAILDQIAGAASPKQLEGERVTAAQVNLVAGREEETRDVIIERFLTQWADLMSTLQKRMVNEDTIEDDAKAMQARLLKIMSREELDALAKSPAASTVADYSELERQQIALVGAENAGNPLIDQKELKLRQLTAQVNEEFANAVMLPDNDPTVTAEQQRLQQLELLILTQGQAVPVSPRDNHRVHLDVLKPAMEQAGMEVAANPAVTPLLQSLVDHASQHIARAQEQGANPEEFAEDVAMVEQLTAALQQLAQLDQAKQEIQGQADQLGQPSLPNAQPV